MAKLDIKKVKVPKYLWKVQIERHDLTAKIGKSSKNKDECVSLLSGYKLERLKNE